ncbi:condensin complex subunit 3 [Toxorhynchites rutilus septentrionalis]|uniref:condensin complex subunit 3 n=1 Tax=Toxorhynchites rutilus septentrionalis TaxID=329112 RepID=UPI00247A62E2|nr:condensin complex subunit 3 [Toxorhynchites rutilus septentrionalis]
MAPRKRKVKVVAPSNSPEKAKFSIVVIQTILNGQESETSHAKLIKELKGIYPTITHESFMKSFIQSLKGSMQHEEANEYANRRLKLCAKFAADPDYCEQPETHPIIVSVFDWLLGTISPAAIVRFRICQFVNLVLNAMGPEASLDDDICDKILRYMLERMRDVAPNVRVQAVLALQRLQNPDDPDDSVFRAYIFHLETDPSSKVRQTIITSLGRNYRTIPYIIERLWDVEGGVRRHTYLQMSSYPVKQYKVAHRLTFLEQGLNDHSEAVRKVVRNVLIPQWFESYQKNYVAFVKALKIDADEKELERFRKTAKLALFEIFSKYGIVDAMSVLGMKEDDKTVPIENLTIETAICWQALLDFLHKTESDELENLSVDLTTFCNYIKIFANNPTSCNYIRMLADDPSMITEKLQKMYFQSMFQILLEMVDSYDFCDEFGREYLKQVLAEVLCCCDLDEENVKIILSIFERLIVDVETRFKFLVDLINDVLEPARVDVSNSARSMVDEYLEKNPDKNLQMKISSLRLTIMDLKEQEMDKVNKKDYAGAQRVSEELNAANDEYAALLKPILMEVSSASDGSTIFRDSMLKPKKITNSTINKCLQIAFYMVNCSTVRTLTPFVCELYKSFISRYVESAEIATRDWALRCSITFSMLYDGLSKETFQLLYQQFFRNHCTRIWQTSIEGIFELLDRYGFEHFDVEAKKDGNRKNVRQLYNTMDYLEQEDDANTSNTGTGVDLMRMMTHFFETCEDNVICSAIVDGFCRLILHGHCTSQDIMSKLLLKYFNPTTESKTQQILGIFFERLIVKKRQEILQKALLTTLFTIMEAPSDSPLQEVKPEHVLKFVVDSTKPVFCSPGLNPHNTIAMSFLQVILDNLNYKDLLKLLTKELLSLEISDDAVLKNDLKVCIESVLQEQSLDPKIIKNLNDFQEMLQGTYREPISFSSSRAPPAGETQESGALSEIEETPEETDENAEIPSKDKEVPQINKSSLQKDDTLLSQSSPAKSAAPAPTETPQAPKTPTTFGADNISGMVSLRKSMSVVGAATAQSEKTVAREIFKVPDATAAKKLRQQQPKASDKNNHSDTVVSDTESGDEQKKSDEHSFAIPSTQDMTGVSSIDGDQSLLHLEIPETQVPAEQQEHLSTSTLKTPTKRKIIDDSSSEEAISASSDESSLGRRRNEKKNEEEAVDASPNATIARLDRSVLRPLVKASAKSIAQSKGLTPQTLPRTRHAARVQVNSSKVSTRKSLSNAADKPGSSRSSLIGIEPLKKTPPKTLKVGADGKKVDSKPKASNSKITETDTSDKGKRKSKEPTNKEIDGLGAKGDSEKTTSFMRTRRSKPDKNESQMELPKKGSGKQSANKVPKSNENSAKPPAPTRSARRTLDKANEPAQTDKKSTPTNNTRATKKLPTSDTSASSRLLTRQRAVDKNESPSSKFGSESQPSSSVSSSSTDSKTSQERVVAERPVTRRSKGPLSSSTSEVPSTVSSQSSLSSVDSTPNTPVRSKRVAVTPLSARYATRATSTPTRPIRKLAKK